MRLITLLFGAGLLLAGIVTTADGSGCVRSRSVFVSHATPYVAPVVASYHAANVVAVEVPVSPEFYYSLGSFYQSQLIADAVIGRLTLLNQQQQQQAPPPTLPGTPPPPMPQASGLPQASPQAPVTINGNSAGKQLVQIVNASCIRCHNSKIAKKGLNLERLDAVTPFQKAKCALMTLDGSMPDGGPQLPDDQAQLFFEWARGGFGAPNVTKR